VSAQGQKALAFFEDLWARGDFWDLERSEFEQARYTRLVELLGGRRHARALEVGCGAGTFTRRVAGVADSVVAVDISPTAIERARLASPSMSAVEFRVANIMEYDVKAEGPWDLVVMSETIYYLGWLYSFFDVGWLASEIFAATSDGGRLLLANTQGGVEDALVYPWLIRTYRDLFLNVGYRLEVEDVFRGAKDGADIEVLMSLFVKGAGP
jgi:SAM-dependent methyltransferase